MYKDDDDGKRRSKRLPGVVSGSRSARTIPTLFSIYTFSVRVSCIAWAREDRY